MILLLILSCEKKTFENPVDPDTELSPDAWAPTNLSIEILTDSDVKLSWEQSITQIDGFKIERKDSTNGAFSEVGMSDSTSYTDTGLIIGEFVGGVYVGDQYYYRVCAYAGDNKSSYDTSSEMIVTSFPAPYNFTATPQTDNKIELTWADSTAYESGFIIQRKNIENETFTVLDSTVANTYQDTTVILDNQYVYKVNAYSQYNTSSYTDDSLVQYWLDCLNVFAGDALEDACGVCDNNPSNDNTPLTGTCDCNAIPNGTAALDNCNICTGGETGVVPCVQDCNDAWGGTDVEDNCGTCDSNASNDCNMDCAGNWGGVLANDNCGTCDNDASNDCPQDCAGTWGGDALVDNCNVCDTDTSNDNTPSTGICDCAGTPNGSVVADCAGVCGGTGVELWGECYNIEETTELNVSESGLTGTIPTEIGELVNLTHLQLNNNQLTGSIPSEIGNLTNLTGLFLHHNSLTGSIPASIGNLTNLTRLLLFENNFTTGDFPSWIENLTNLTELDLDGCGLTGEIPSWIGNLTNLIHLFLKGNQLTGEIPSEIGNLINLETLHLAGNQLVGEIPESICNPINLSNPLNSNPMELYGNKLCPPYPECVENYVGEQDISACDCAGTWGGTATADNCGVCDSDSSNDNTTCTQDCAGTWGGSAVDANGNGICDSDETDTQLPSATILSPASGATVSEITTIEVYATDNFGIQKIEFYIADILKLTDTESPYEYEWNTSSYSDGVDYTIMVKAFDTSDNMTIVAPILLTVENTGKYPTTPTIYGRYEDSKFLLSWTQNSDSDFASYTLYESTNADMADSTAIYTTDSNQNISYEVTGIGADTRRYYRLIITDTIGLKSASNLQGVSNYQKIAFRLGFDINIIDIDGENRTNLTSEIDGMVWSSKFTPNGKKIIYPYIEQSGANGDYYIMNIDGTEKTNITNGSVTNDIDLTGYKISSDGTKILFSDKGSCSDIWIINIDGTGLTNLTNNRTTCDRSLDFSSDGQKIVFLSDGVIHTMDSNGGSVTNLSVSGEYPLYSPAGDKIAYKVRPHLWIMNSDGSNPIQLTTSVTVPSSEMAEAVFSPNGQSLVYRTGGSYLGVGFINIDGTGETNLTTDIETDGISLSSDGQKIVYAESGTTYYIKLINIDGTNVKTIYGCTTCGVGSNNLNYPVIQPIP